MGVTHPQVLRSASACVPRADARGRPGVTGTCGRGRTGDGDAEDYHAHGRAGPARPSVSVAQAVAQTFGHRHDVAALLRLARDLPAFLRTPVTLAEAHDRVRERLTAREARFLSVVDRTMYGHPGNPYLRLLRAAGCEFGQLLCIARSATRRRGAAGQPWHDRPIHQ